MRTRKEFSITRDFGRDLGKAVSKHFIAYTIFLCMHYLSHSPYLAWQSILLSSVLVMCSIQKTVLYSSSSSWATVPNDWPKASDSLVHRSIPALVNSVAEDRVTRQDIGKWITLACERMTRRLFKLYDQLETTWQTSNAFFALQKLCFGTTEMIQQVRALATQILY